MNELIQAVGRCNDDNHSNDNLDEIHETTDLDRYRISECQRVCPHTMGRCELHKKALYGKGLIVKKLGDVYGGARRAADLKGKCRWDARARLGTLGRTMGTCARAAGLLVLLALLAVSDAAPVRAARSTHHQTSVVSYFVSCNLW